MAEIVNEINWLHFQFFNWSWYFRSVEIKLSKIFISYYWHYWGNTVSRCIPTYVSFPCVWLWVDALCLELENFRLHNLVRLLWHCTLLCSYWWLVCHRCEISLNFTVCSVSLPYGFRYFLFGCLLPARCSELDWFSLSFPLRVIYDLLSVSSCC